LRNFVKISGRISQEVKYEVYRFCRSWICLFYFFTRPRQCKPNYWKI